MKALFLKTRVLNQYERYILEVAGRYDMDEFDKDNLFTTERGLVVRSIFMSGSKIVVEALSCGICDLD